MIDTTSDYGYYDPDGDADWFPPPTYKNPLDSMPIATNNPRPEEEIADAYASRHESTPNFEKEAEEVVTMHEKAYRLARAKYNPFAVGGTEQLGGGSETIQK